MGLGRSARALPKCRLLMLMLMPMLMLMLCTDVAALY